MKTFEEAVKLIDPLKESQVRHFDLKYGCLTDDVKGSAEVHRMIETYKTTVRLCCYAHLLAEFEACAKVFFHFGLAVGIEMTKADE